MRLRLTKEVQNHKYNDNYRCVLVELKGNPRFRFELDVDWEKREIRLVRANWMPTDKECLDVVLRLIQDSPSFWPLLLEHVKPATHVHDFI